MKLYLDIFSTSDEYKYTYETFFVVEQNNDIAQIIAQIAERWDAKPNEMRCFVLTKKQFENKLHFANNCMAYCHEKQGYILCTDWKMFGEEETAFINNN